MVALPVAVGSFATTALWSAQDTPETVAQRELGPDFQASLVATGLTITQTPDVTGHGGSSPVIGPRPLADVEADLRAELPAGDRLVRLVQAQGAGIDVRADGLGLTIPSVLQGDLTDPAVRGAFRLEDGELPADGEVALSAWTARELGVAVGDRVTLARDEGEELPATVSGLLDDPAPRQTDVLLPASGPLSTPATAPAPDGDGDPEGFVWFVAGDAPVTWDDVLALNELGALVVSRDVLLSPPPVEAVEFYDGRPPESTSDRLQQWVPLAAVVAVALLEVVLLIGPAFAVGARRSARSLALIAASGGTRRTLRAVVLGTGVVIGVLASVTGTVVGVGAASLVIEYWTDAAPVVPWAPVAAILAVGVTLAAGAAWLPARRASKADVVAVLAGRRGETSYRRWPVVVGAVLGAVGFAGALAAGFAGQALGVAAGVVAGELGLVLACGGIVAALGHLARHLPLAWRFALRDAARHRGRTAPALAAVLVAVAGASGGLVYSSSQTAHDDRSQALVAAPDVLVIGAADVAADSRLTREEGERVEAVVHDVLPDLGRLYPVTVLRGPHDGATSTGVSLPTGPGAPEGGYHRVTTGIEVATGIVGPVVDDGTLVPLLGLPDPDAAAASLAEGRAVVQAGTVDDDGTVALDVVTRDVETQDPTGRRTVRVPATGVGDPLGPSNANFPVVPPSAAAATGTSPALGGFVAMPGTPLGEAERQTLQAALDEAFSTSEAENCTVCVSLGAGPSDYGSPQWLSTLLIVGSAGLLALAAAWIVAALAATESRPDLATLAAVGAAPTTRKRIVAAQAGTVATIGSVLGGASGVVLGAAFVLFERFRYAEPDPRWTVEVPWPVLAATLIALPLLAVAAAWLVTRSRLVLTRRLAS